MPVVDPGQQDDDRLPGSGLHLDLDTRVCPVCRQQAPPWQARCPTCDEPTVHPADLPAPGFALPGLGEEEPADGPEPTDDP